MKTCMSVLLVIVAACTMASANDFPFTIDLALSDNIVDVNQTTTIKFTLVSNVDAQTSMSVTLPPSLKTDDSATWSGFLNTSEEHVLTVNILPTEAGRFTVYANANNTLPYDWFRMSKSVQVLVGEYTPFAGITVTPVVPNATVEPVENPLELNLSVKTSDNVSKTDRVPLKVVLDTNMLAEANLEIILSDPDISVVTATPDSAVIGQNSIGWSGRINKKMVLEAVLFYETAGTKYITITATSGNITKIERIQVYVAGEPETIETGPVETNATGGNETAKIPVKGKPKVKQIAGEGGNDDLSALYLAGFLLALVIILSPIIIHRLRGRGR